LTLTKPDPGRQEILVPTKAELDILRVLWTRGPLSVRDVQQALSESKDVNRLGSARVGNRPGQPANLVNH
jgi:hypothetical protein